MGRRSRRVQKQSQSMHLHIVRVSDFSIVTALIPPDMHQEWMCIKAALDPVAAVKPMYNGEESFLSPNMEERLRLLYVRRGAVGLDA